MEQASENKLYFCSLQFLSLTSYFEDVKQRKKVWILILSLRSL
jgi:hypothetical protein